MIKTENLFFGRGKDNLVENGNLSIYPNQKVGLIGSNGSGKSTFFDLLLGNGHIAQGEYSIPKNWVFAHVSQLIPQSEESALDFVLNGDKQYRSLNQQLETALLNNQSDNPDNQSNTIAWLHHELELIDAYRIPSKASELLNGLGFSKEEQLKPVNTFSGGWRVRLNLAQALMCRSDCLLLDEPTNHLDISAILWLENWLKNYTGTVIIIAHDSAFLDNIVDAIIVIENKNFHTYKGNYSQYLKQRADQLALQQKMHEKQLKAQAHLKKFIDKFRAKASKAKQAQSRIKQLGRMQIIQAVHAQSPFEFHFKELERCPNPLISIDKATIGYHENCPIIQNIKLRLSPGDRIGLLGENGAGKSTFIKLLAGELLPLSGSMVRSPQLKIGYFSQHQVEQLDTSSTPFDHLLKLSPKTTEQAIRTYLGGFGFSGDKAYQQVSSLSGGEKARLTLALIVFHNPHLLLLDEPTNHLDIEMREALSLALQEFEGALVVISHDRQLISETTEELYLIQDGIIKPFEGDMLEYCQLLAKKKTAKPSNQSGSGQQTNFTDQTPALKPKSNSISKSNTLKKIKNLEKELEQLTQELSELERQLSDSNLYTQTAQNRSLKLETASLLTLQKTFTDKKAQLLQKEEAWLEATALLEQNASDDKLN